MAPPSDPDLLVLLGLRLKSLASAPTLEAPTGLALADIEARLERLAADGLVRHRDAAPTGWLLEPAGRAEVTRLVVAERDARDVRDELDAAYRRFLALNQPLLRACTDWQLRGATGVGVPVVNDHTDLAYDADVLAALGALDREVQPICADLAATLARFGGYGPRLRRALGRTLAGEADWFAKATIDSYHTVWFELHENLLTTLGIERGTEVLT